MNQPCHLPSSTSPAGPTSFAAYLPPPPRPPHDPYTLPLDGRLGWRGEAALPAALMPRETDGALMLPAQPESGRRFDEPGGSFGGLVLPRHLAWTEPGRARRTVLLYTPRRLLRFDPCDCVFHEPFCFRRNDPRLPLGEAAIAVVCQRLYLADRLGRRVILLDAIHGAARGVWRAPLTTPAGQLAQWEPVALAAGPDGSVWVADRLNGVLLRFAAEGRVIERHDGFGAVWALARDRHGRLLIQCDGHAEPIDYDPVSRIRYPSPTRPDELIERFAPLPLTVFPDGSVDLAGLCLPPRSTAHPFGPDGQPLATLPALPPVLFPTQGQWWSQPLDSGIADCVWDRIVLDAELPPHTTLALDVLTADTELPPDELVASRDWYTVLTLHGEPDQAERLSGLDFLLRAPPGRYLWLRLRMYGQGGDSPALTALRIDFPRISWRRYLPAAFGAEPVSAEFTDRWLALFDRTFRQIEAQIDGQAGWFDPLSAPSGDGADFLSWLASWVGVTLSGNWPLERQREFLKQAPRTYAWRGTPRGLTHTLYLLLGLQRWCDHQPAQADCVPCGLTIAERYRWRPPRLLLEHHLLRRWLWLGHARLSDHARLWGERIVNRSQLGAGAAKPPQPGCPRPAGSETDGEAGVSDLYIQGAVPPAAGRPGQAQLGVTQLKTSQDPARDPFHVYAHKLSVFVPAACINTPQRARALSRMLHADTPAHVETRLVPVEPRFRIGVQAMLGLDAVIGYRAAPTELDGMTLGRGTVLDEAADGRAGLRVGHRRIGMDTSLQ
ncbi:phage tail protein [Chitinimonas lacunae]|uniref:Phage tail protein n=1 Tax=Chitinimonas lacunae TaxID=1963018 RepID=A0ABV8MP56_9NEIS